MKTRTPIKIYYDPEDRYVTILELHKITGINRSTLLQRYKRGDKGPRLWCPIEEYKSESGYRDVIYTEYDNRMITLKELSEIINVQRKTLIQRYARGDRGQRLAQPVDKYEHRVKNTPGYIDYYGEMITLAELSAITQICRTTLSMRYKKGDRGERLWRKTENKGKKKRPTSCKEE